MKMPEQADTPLYDKRGLKKARLLRWNIE